MTVDLVRFLSCRMNGSTEEDAIYLGMESALFTQVAFTDVPPAYPPNSPVTCGYMITGALQPNPRDWIGVFKVGWSSTQNYYNYVWVEPSLDRLGPEPARQQVLFSASLLPQEDGEDYQFCYVDSTGQVRGASTPFCFKTPREDSLDSDIEKDLLIITTQEAAEQSEREREDLQKENKDLKENNQILKNELDERLREIHKLRMRLEHEPQSPNGPENPPQTPPCPSPDRAEDSQQESESLSSMHKKYKKAVENIGLLKQNRAGLQEQLEAQELIITQLSAGVKESEQTCHKLQDEIQLLQLDLRSSRKDQEKLQSELLGLRGLRRELEELQQENQVLLVRANVSERSSKDEGSKVVQVEAILRQLTEARGLLRQEIQNNNEAQRRIDRTEQELRKVKGQLEESRADRARLEELEVKVQEQEDENDRLTKENEVIRDEAERLRQAVTDLQIAAVTASVSLLRAEPGTSPPGHAGGQSQPPTTPRASIQGYNEDENTKALECQHCRGSFPGFSAEELIQHEESHMVCPFCTLICDGLGQQEFEDHVYSHED